MSTLVDIAERLCTDVDALHFAPPVSVVYNPLAYARAAHRTYLERYGRGSKAVVIVGMNPGPFGMVQTGVPFGEVAVVRDWLRIDEGVERPRIEHPRRPIEGFTCRRSEVSGRRLWGWLQRRFGEPERMAERVFVANYCPLAFIEETGRNRTPDKLPVAERVPLMEACDRALRAVLETTQTRTVIAVGHFAAERIRPLAELLGARCVQILHPSPASPAANRGWEAQVEAKLHEMHVEL